MAKLRKFCLCSFLFQPTVHWASSLMLLLLRIQWTLSWHDANLKVSLKIIALKYWRVHSTKKFCAWAFCLFCYYCLTLKLRQVSKSSARFGTSRTNTRRPPKIWFCSSEFYWTWSAYMHASPFLTTGKFNKINFPITTMSGFCLCHLFEGKAGFLSKTALIAELLKTQNRRLSLRYVNGWI